MKFHPDIDLLLKYANGQLEPALAIAVGLHHQQCPQCQSHIADIESLAGEGLELSNNAPLAENSFEQLLNELDSLPVDNFSDSVEAEREHCTELSSLAVAESDLALVEKFYQQNFDDVKWQKITRKIAQATIDFDDPRYQIKLLKLQPNAKTAKHTHRGSEFTVVLQGDFSDQYGHYSQGEFIFMDEKNEHQPRAGRDGCICLAITDQPLKFTGVLAPVINWMAN